MTRPLTLAFAGDVMLGRLVNESLAGGNYACPWGDLLPVLRPVDLFLVNLECALTARTQRWSDGGYKPFYFRADPAAVATLQLGRVNFASLANNHIEDFGPEGLRDTLDVLDRAGIAHAGAGVHRSAAREPARLTVDGTRIGVVAFADYPEEWRATATGPGINYTPVSLDLEHFDDVRQALAAAREQADVVVFSIHWGPNMCARPTPDFRKFARAVIDAGADIFWGHSAHIVQGVEPRRGRLILYDTGDFIDDYAVDDYLRNDLSALFLVRLSPPVVEELEVVPVRIEDMQVNLARGRERDWFIDRFRTRCAELGTEVIVAPEKVRVSVTAERERSRTEAATQA